jgi:hypothetical protein
MLSFCLSTFRSTTLGICSPGGRSHAVVDQLDAGGLLVEEDAVVLVAEHQDVQAGAFEVLTIVQRQRTVLGEDIPAEKQWNDQQRPGQWCSCRNMLHEIEESAHDVLRSGV